MGASKEWQQVGSGREWRRDERAAADRGAGAGWGSCIVYTSFFLIGILGVILLWAEGCWTVTGRVPYIASSSNDVFPQFKVTIHFLNKDKPPDKF